MRRAHQNRKQQRKGESLTSFFAVFLLIAVRFLYCGFQYFPQLDDYIQHHNYAMQGSFFSIIEKLGLLAARPLAGILDITLWSWLWPCAIVGVLLLSAMYASAAVQFQRIFARLFGTSPFFLVIFSLLPLGMEGTYWMSASTRIIPGLLFVSLSANYLLRFFEYSGRRNAVLVFFFQFLAFCLYEQAAVLSCALNVLLALLLIRQSEKRWIFAFSCILTAALYFLCCELAGPSALYDGRTNIILPKPGYYFDTFLPDLLSQLYSAFLGGGYYTFAYGFIRGIMRIVQDGAWLYCLGILAICIFFGFISARMHAERHGKFLAPLCIGILLIFAPLAPFFVIENPWFSLRGTVTSFVGIALVADALIRLLTRNKKRAIAVLGSLTACIFCICSVSEIADYRANYEADMRVVSKIATLAPAHPDGGKVAILNVDPSYVSELNCRYHEHIVGVTESSWALTGAIRCYNENPNEWITYVPISLKKDPIYKKWNYTTMTIGSMDGVYLYEYAENTLEPLTVSYSGDGHFELYRENGEKYGTVVEENEIGRFFEE